MSGSRSARPPTTPKARSSRTSRCRARRTTPSAPNFLLVRARRPVSAATSQDFNVNDAVRFIFATARRTSACRACRASEQHPAGYSNVPRTTASTTTRRRATPGRSTRPTSRSAAGTAPAQRRLADRSPRQRRHQRQPPERDQPELGLAERGRHRIGTVRLLRSGQQRAVVYQSRASSRRATSSRTSTASSCRTTWNVNNRLTINAGIRTESENVPGLLARSPACRPIRSSSGGGTRSRRASGFAYDLKGDGQIEALWLVGHVLRHLQAEPAARLVRRRQVDLVLLHARHAELRVAARLAAARRLPGHVPRQRRLPRSHR